MLHDWSVAKSRRAADFNQSSERKFNPNASKLQEIAVMLKPEGFPKLQEDKVYVDEATFLEIESSLEDSSFTS